MKQKSINVHLGFFSFCYCVYLKTKYKSLCVVCYLCFQSIFQYRKILNISGEILLLERYVYIDIYYLLEINDENSRQFNYIDLIYY